jgi:hypothetical protein
MRKHAAALREQTLLDDEGFFEIIPARGGLLVIR